jgi:hypothetical protein
VKTYLYTFLFITLSCSLLSHAQEASNKKEILPAKLAIIAIGPKPPRRFGSADEDKATSAAALLPPKPGEIPPRKLFIQVNEKEKKSAVTTEGENKIPQILKSINVTFNNPSHFIEVPPNKTLQLQRRDSTEDEPADYISIEPLEPGSLTLVLLRPTGTGDNRWVPEPRQHKVNLLDDTLKTKRLAILNLSRRPVKSIFHKEQEMIPSGGFQSYESIEGLELHRIAAAYGQENKIIFNTALRLNNSDRLLFYVLYDSNPNTNDGRTVGLFRTSMDPEEAPKEPLKEEVTETLPPEPEEE